jgi:hypothetical protein
LRFWNKVRKSKKSIIEKQEEFFVCSGEIDYRGKGVVGCVVLEGEQLLLVNYGD